MEVISMENCQKVFENAVKSTEFEIIDTKVVSLEGIVRGMMAEYFKLIITAKIECKTVVKNFFCKKLVMFHKIQEVMGRTQGAYEKEAYIYNYIIPKLNNISNFTINFAPKCYLTLNHDLFVLDELLEMGYTKSQILYNVQKCKLAIEKIAQFHAMSLILEEQESKLGKRLNLYEKDPDIYKDSLYRKDEDYLGRAWYKNCHNAVLKLIDLLPELERSKDELKQKYNRETERMYEIITPSKVYRNVCCHGDLSISNILFKYDGEKAVDCKLVDYQALRYNPPAHDVVTFLYLTTNRKFRDQHYTELLDYYYDNLQKQLLKCDMDLAEYITKKEFDESCRYVRPFVVLQAAFYSTMFPANVLFLHIVKDQEVYKRYVYGDRSPECIEAYHMSSTYKETITDIIDEFSKL